MFAAHFFVIPLQFFQTPDRNKPALQKRLSHMTMSLSGKFGEANQAEECVPLSPLKPDFSTDHPLGVQRSQAIRKISFDGPSCEDAKVGDDKETSRLRHPVHRFMFDFENYMCAKCVVEIFTVAYSTSSPSCLQFSARVCV